MTPEKRSEANRVRQARWRKNHPEIVRESTPESRAKAALAARRAYNKKKLRLANSGSVAERSAIKESTLKPDTLRKKKRSTELTSNAFSVMSHYKSLLTSSIPSVRRVALAWFRVTKHVENPYFVFDLEKPLTLLSSELKQPIPFHWRFHASDLSKNYHPPL